MDQERMDQDTAVGKFERRELFRSGFSHQLRAGSARLARCGFLLTYELSSAVGGSEIDVYAHDLSVPNLQILRVAKQVAVLQFARVRHKDAIGILCGTFDSKVQKAIAARPTTAEVTRPVDRVVVRARKRKVSANQQLGILAPPFKKSLEERLGGRSCSVTDVHRPIHAV
jgi:hypothetical protein